jgi:glycosyltransferase involved in cell wall biosynthesis
VPEKGWDVLLAAVAQLRGEWVLQMAGAGPERPRLEAMAHQLGIAERVQWVGARRSGEMPAFLQGLDVLVLPSRTMPNWMEQFGRVLIEAMACETAVIGSDSGEIPHVIGGAGLTFPEDNAPALAHQLQLLLEHPEQRREFGRAGRQRVLAHYTQEQIAQQTVGVYGLMMGRDGHLR